MEKERCNLQGLEISQTRREIAQQHCRSRIFNYNLMKNEIPLDWINKYDIIVAFHVLEHIIDPFTFLKNISKILANNGTLIIEVPNVDDHLLDFCPSYRNFYWQRAHVSYFSPETIRNVLADSGFKDVKIMGIQRYSIKNMMNWLINNKPQLDSPSYDVDKNIAWIDVFYKKELEEQLKCDTLIVVARK